MQNDLESDYGMPVTDYRDNIKSDTDPIYNEDGTGDQLKPQKSSLANKKPGVQTNGSEKKTTFAALPNQTTWQQQKIINNIYNVQEVPSIPGEDL